MKKKSLKSLFKVTLLLMFIFSFNACSQRDENLINTSIKKNKDVEEPVIEPEGFLVLISMKNGNTFPLLYNNKYESINLPADFNDNVRSIIIERADLNIPVSLVMFKNQNFRGVKKTLTLGPSEKFKEFFLADIQLYNFIFKYKRWDTNISSFRIQK